MIRLIAGVIFTLLVAFETNGQNISNGSFETWRNYYSGGQGLVSPDGWFGGDSLFNSMLIYATSTNSQILRTSSAHSGASAVKIVTAVYGSKKSDSIPGILANAKLFIDSVSGELRVAEMPKVNHRINSVSAWVKYTPVLNDTGVFAVRLYNSGILNSNGGDSVVGSGEIGISALSSYASLTVPIVYVDSNVVPDRILIMFASSGFGRTNTPGTALYVDDIKIDNSVTNVESNSGIDVNIQCYPNPSSGRLTLKSEVSSPTVWNLYSAVGHWVFSKTFVSESSFSIDGLSYGTYVYSFIDENHKVVKTGNLVFRP